MAKMLKINLVQAQGRKADVGTFLNQVQVYHCRAAKSKGNKSIQLDVLAPYEDAVVKIARQNGLERAN